MSELVSDKFICTYLLGKANHIFNTEEINLHGKQLSHQNVSFSKSITLTDARTRSSHSG